MNIHIDAKTLEEKFSKNEIKIIKQLQDVSINGGNPPQMTPEGRTILMEKLNNINTKQTQTKDSKYMTTEELAIHKKDIREKLRNKINFKAETRTSKFNQSKTSVNNLVNTSNSDAVPAPVPLDLTNIDSLKNIVNQITNSNSNPEAKRRLESLFGTDNLDNMLKEDKMKELLDINGFSNLLKNFTKTGTTKELEKSVIKKLTEPIESNKNPKNSKKKSKNKKKKLCVIENNNSENDEELLDDYVENNIEDIIIKEQE
jgi:hypothetical protein